MKALRGIFSGIQKIFRRVSAFFASGRSRISRYVDTNPYRSFYAVLGILFALIVLSNWVGTPKIEQKREAAVVKDVTLFTIGTAPKTKVLARVEKSGVVTVTALAPGVVSYIRPSVGSQVSPGQNLIGLSSNYQGGNTSSLSRQLAEVQYKNAKDTKDLQKDIIRIQKELAEKADANADELRAITDKSISETNDLITINGQILSSLDATILEYEQTNVNGANDDAILGQRQLKTQFLSAMNMARQGLRMAEYGASGDKPPAALSNLQKDAALRQLELQEKMTDMQLEIAGISLSIARTVEAMMYPAAPFSGTVERIFVKPGQAVNPGTPLMVISGDPANKPIIAVAHVSRDVAAIVSKTEASIISINGTTSLKAYPMYVSTDAVSGTLHAVQYLIPPDYARLVTENGFITIDIPVGAAGAGSAVPYIPIDAVYQTKDDDYVYVARDGIAVSVTIELGDVIGSYVEVKKGLQTSDAVIANRNIIAGDAVAGSVQ